MSTFAASIERPKTKSATASRGLNPQTPVIGSRYRARHGAVPPRYSGLEPPLITSMSDIDGTYGQSAQATAGLFVLNLSALLSYSRPNSSFFYQNHAFLYAAEYSCAVPFVLIHIRF